MDCTSSLGLSSKAAVLTQDNWKVRHWMLPELCNQARHDAVGLVSRRDEQLCRKIVPIKKRQQHCLDLNAFATLIQNVATVLNVEIIWIEVVVLMLRGPTKFVLKGAGDLNLV